MGKSLKFLDSPIDERPIAPEASRNWSAADIGPIEQVVLQATPFCNINCSYCYLPTRDRLEQMSVATAARVMEFVGQSGRYISDLEIRWHAGEPLVVPVEFYREAIRAIRHSAPPGLRARHTLQTNGLLVDQEWCEFFKEEGIRVGLSLDGPAFLHDLVRVTRAGQGTHHAVMRAAKLLRSNDVEFSVLAVLTDKSFDYPDELFSFFADIAPSRIGFNVEETEGAHESSSVGHREAVSRFRRFMARIYELQCDGRLKIRDIDSIRDAIFFGNGDRGNRMVSPFSIVAVDWGGNLSSFSPELLGQKHWRYGSFHFGNVWTHSLEDMLSSPVFLRMEAEISGGVQACRRSCGYFSLCGGGAPSNKLYENGTFTSTETFHCRTNIKSLVDLCLEKIERDRG